jgi:putative glutamine amidotransferase
MAKPLIGITTFRVTSKIGLTVQGITQAYVEAVRDTGALPVLIPLGLNEADLDQLFANLDGLVLTGGGDLDPASYGADMHPTIYNIDQDRDRIEMHLAHRFIDDAKPFLAICRGMQVLNVALGGDLFTDIEDKHPGGAKHSFWPGYPRDHRAHAVQINEGTRLADIMGEPILEVNSIHHQAVNRLAEGLKATAFSPDGVLEAVELPDHPFGLGVQWHPEALMDVPSTRLFEALVAASNGAE